MQLLGLTIGVVDLIVQNSVEDNNVKTMLPTDYVLLMAPCYNNQAPRLRIA
jgi:hypothetical protein